MALYVTTAQQICPQK